VSCRTSANVLVAPRTQGLSRVRGGRLRNSFLPNAIGSATAPERDMYDVRRVTGQVSCRTAANLLVALRYRPGEASCCVQVACREPDSYFSRSETLDVATI